MSEKSNRIRLGVKAGNAIIALASFLLLGLVEIALAHSDPWGDIHPQVSVVDGKFSVVFRSSQPEQVSDYSEGKPVQQMIFNADGTLFAPRHPLKQMRVHEEIGPVGLYRRKIRFGESTVIFQGDQSPKPGYVLESPGGKIMQVRLPWPKAVSLSLFEDACVTPEGIAITGKVGTSHRQDDPLMFFWFAHEETGAPTILDLGATACIYDFPVASNIAFAGGRFWVAYMRLTDDGQDLKLALWSWKLGDQDGRVEVLDSPAFWNSHLSMAAIGDRLCLAYHCVVPDRANNQNARIVTVFRKAQ